MIEPAEDSAVLTPQERGRNLRLRLVGAIGEFLVEHDLEITPHNLAIAHSAVSGLNPRLMRKIARQRESGVAVTQDWLDTVTASEAKEEDKAVEQLIGQLEDTIAQFKRSTHTAHTASREYGDALAEHVDKLDKVPDAGDMISELATYARAMLKRSRRAEAELRQSEEEAANLRHTLDRARRDAEIDFLTGLPNRRAFEAELRRNYDEARSSGEPLCLAFCDIDHFKSVNDTHGHDAGDRVICVVAKTLSEISGHRCHIARHGGEEFVMLFRGSHQHAAFEALDEARAALAARKLVNRRNKLPFGQITFSGGIADVFAYATPNEALAAADEALYRAKEGGRNRIELAVPQVQAKAA
ncbi:diguanylate cyclase [Altererythrobacter buctensis]|uniref:diguanylate cyclase n=2 Tax=Alteraurantiacibacter buctensis TaxID=1503981 RepID=A0A844YWH7_9SPHN|nr:diguanylate cyclase [Alteraurantiacibacter buctensis]